MKSNNFGLSKKIYGKSQIKGFGPNIQDGRDAAYIDFNRRLIIMAKQKPNLEQRINFCKIAHGNMIEFLHNREVIQRFTIPFCGCRDDFIEYAKELGEFAKELYHDIQEGIKSGEIVQDPTIPKPDPLHENAPLQFFHDIDMEEPYEGVYKPIHLIPHIDESSTVVQDVVNVPKQFPWTGEQPFRYVKSVEESVNNKIAFPAFRSDLIYTNEPKADMVECTATKLNIRLPIEMLLIYTKYNFVYDQNSDLGDHHIEYDYFEDLKNGQQMLIDCPYESYQMVVDFIDQMCHHPEIKTIGITLYRVADNSAIIRSIMDAIELGKTVMIFLEVKARGNEIFNCDLYWKLISLNSEHLIIKPVYYMYKTHAKIFVAVTHDSHIYYHNGTGNYNEDTAKLYTDLNVLGYDDCNAEYSLEKILNLVLGKCLSSSTQYFKDMYNAGIDIQRTHNNIIDNTRFNIVSMILCAMKEGLPIYIKCNHFLDQDIARRVLAAAESGCKVMVIARTSSPILDHPNIKIRSVIGNFLEHSRLYIIGNPKYSTFMGMIGSCDLLYRNLNKRVEHLCQLDDDALEKAWGIFETSWNFDEIEPIQIKSDSDV